MKTLKPYYIISGFIVLICGCNPVIKSDFYLPKNYKGEVAIIYGYKTGHEQVIKDGRQQFLIPDSGILFTKAHLQYGQVDEKYYIKREKEFKELIPYTFQSDNSSEKYIYGNRVETILCLNKKNKSISYSIRFFSVGQDIDSIANKKRFLFVSHIKQLLDCQ